MKFAYDKGILKYPFGIKMIELCLSDNPFPIDCAIAYLRNDTYPCKINHGFYEMFFILDGECSVKFKDKTVILKKNDVHIIEIGKKHVTTAVYADILIACVPPFDIKNVEFCSM